MSFQVQTTIEKFPQKAFQFVPYEAFGENATFEDFPILGGILSDLKHIWHAKGPCLEIRQTTSGRKVGSWTFGGVLRDSNTKITAVEELKRNHGRLSLLIVALDCTLSGGLICVFDVFGSRVLRVVQIEEKITNILVIDPACDNNVVLPEDSSPLKYFDGILAVGTLGGNVYLLDLCKQICENALQNMDTDIRDEVNPCRMFILKKEKIANIKKYVNRSVEHEEHLAIHLNIVLDSPTEHFTLKGEKGDDRVHVNKSEAEVSALFYSQQIASLLIGYNFGAFQIWDLRSLNILYTSPICEGLIPVTNFTIQEPADDPKAYCYIWVSYSHNLLYQSGLPFAVMYSFYFDSKSFLNGYGNLYEDFQHCSIRFELQLGDTLTSTLKSSVKGGICLGLQSVSKCPTNKDLHSLALCLVSWLFWDSDGIVNTGVLLFDLNQWYKEQMPRVPNWLDCSNYFIKNGVGRKLLSVKMDQKSLSQFMGIQRLEEHFCPTSLSFDLLAISEHSIYKIHNKGHQKAFLDKIMNDQHLALINPVNYTEQIVNLGLVPLFYEIQVNNYSQDVNYQRDLLLSVALEQKLIGWLCKVTSELANNAFSAAGLTLYNMLHWAFQRAVTIKNSCDKYCVSLFDYSGIKLDDNIITLISCGTSQIRNLCSFYRYVSSKLLDFVADKDSLLEEQRSLENVVVYFEVLLWMVNTGLLPEFQVKTQVDSLISAPYLVQDLTEYYNRKRAQLQLVSKETFVEKDCLLFIDNMISSEVVVDSLRQQWQEDGGSGLYPPPSLQSLLRIYLLDGPDFVFKHSLVTYTLLDIAMTVDEHNKIIKLLLKFPQIFDLTQSNIKIIQGFWHLDHDDYETALECILDPSILVEDLKPWHHSMMMKSLLLQDQSSLALWYLQVKKPSIQDENDLLTIISLLVSKNMLDEAFKFRLQHKGPNEYDLLTHIFNECNKNERLHSLLYRRLNTDEEKVFFNYLQNTKNPKCEDLKVFYYLLRSRFLEAFDTYSLMKRRQPDTQGLIGQRDASTADNIVKMFKSLLPDVNKNLVELVRKERSNLWKEVPKPMPLSVFVHNAKDKIYYKSSVIFAALAKAKQTFNDTLNETKCNDVTTEDTPFLKTPLVFKNETSVGTPLINFKFIENYEEDGPSPAKKLKLSPRLSKTTPNKSRNLSLSIVQSKLSTPIIRRKRQSLEAINSTTILPQSILKSRTILEGSTFNDSSRRFTFGLSPRKSVRTPLKSHVQFTGVRSSGSSNSTEQNSTASMAENLSKQSNHTTVSLDDVFYSPDHSFEGKDRPVKDSEEVLSISESKQTPHLNDSMTVDDQQPATSTTPKDISIKITVPIEENDLTTKRLSFQSPKCRKSYRKSLGETSSPIRSSPRLAKKNYKEDSTTETSTESTSKLSSPSAAVQKLRGRRTLARSVLENNLRKSHNIFEDSKNCSRKPELSFTSDSDISYNNDSLEAFWEEIQNNMNSDTSLETDAENIDVVSKVTEVSNVETHRESLRSRDTGNIVSTTEKKEEFYMKIVEEFGEDVEMKETDDGKNSEREIEENVENDDKKLEEESLLEQQSEKRDAVAADDKQEEINVFDDLSSASEDAKEALQNRTNETKSYTNITSTSSFYQDAKPAAQISETLQQPKDIFEDVDSDEEVPETELAFINTQEVIEIGSSSDEEPETSSSSSSEANTSNSGSVKGSIESYLNRSTGRDECSNESWLSYNVQRNELENQLVIETRDSATNDDNFNEETVKNVEENLQKQIDLENLMDIEEEHMDSLQLDNSEEKVAEIQVEQPEKAIAELLKAEGKEVSNTAEEVVEDNLHEVSAQDDIVMESSKTEEMNTVATERQSISIQCTLLHGDFEESTLQNDESSIEETDIDKETLEKRSVSLQCTLGTPTINNSTLITEPTTLKLKTVKRTYGSKVRKGSTSTDIEVDDYSPKVAVDLIKNTYSRKIRLFTEENDELVEEDKIEKNIEENDKKPDLDAAGDQEIASIDKDSKKSDEMKFIEGSEKNIKPSEALSVETPKEVAEEKNEATAVRMTRRRSLLLSQPEYEEFETNKSEKALSETTTSQSTSSSQSPSRRKSRRILSLSMFDDKTLSESPKKVDVMDTSLIEVQNMVETLKKKEVSSKSAETPKSPTATKRRTTRKLLKDVDIQTSTDSDPKELEQEQADNKTEDATEHEVESAKVNAKRTTRTSKSRASSVASEEPAQKPLRQRTRSFSNDHSAQRRLIRSKSVDLDDTKLSRADGKIDLQSLLTPIGEIPSTSKEASKLRTKSTSLYTSSRRLTRKQSSMLETKLPAIEEIDPLNLLDKPEFKGQPDPDEAKIYDKSNSPSNSDAPSRHTRSASVLSDVTGIKSRLRRPSADTMSVLSDSPSPPKRTRTRGNSVSLMRSDESRGTNTSTRSTRKKKAQSVVDLPEIQEEKGTEGEHVEKSNVKRRGRKRKE